MKLRLQEYTSGSSTLLLLWMVADMLLLFEAASECSHGYVRLVNGTTPHEGRVEVCLDNRWGTVCEDSWDIRDAQVVCRQLEISGEGIQALSGAAFGRGVGPVSLDNVECVGNESRLFDCMYNSQENNCSHQEDAGVICQACSDGDVRLVGGITSTAHEGRIEVCLNHRWGTVCDDSWNDDDARVVCRQLGLPYERALALTGAVFGGGSGDIVLDDVQCSGNESGLVNCTHSTQPDPICTHFNDAGVRCNPCTDGDIRLIGGSIAWEGRVEVCFDREWGTICDDHWTTNEAQVICRQAGHSDQGSLAFGQAEYGEGSGGIFLDDVYCMGNESRLIDCNFSRSHDCGHFEDAGVRCQVSTSSNLLQICFNLDNQDCGNPSNSTVFDTCRTYCLVLQLLSIPCTHCDNFTTFLESNSPDVCTDYDGRGAVLCLDICFATSHSLLPLQLSEEFCNEAITELCSQNCSAIEAVSAYSESCIALCYSTYVSDVSRVCSSNPCADIPSPCPAYYERLNCTKKNDSAICLSLCQNQTANPIRLECSGAEELLGFCENNLCMIPGYSDLDCDVNKELCLDLCQNETESAIGNCPTLSNFCNQNFCNIAGYVNLNCEQNESLCLDLCRDNQTDVRNLVTGNCTMLLKFCNIRFCDVNGYSQLNCSGVDNARCAELCDDNSDGDQVRMRNGMIGALRCDTIWNFCNNDTCNSLVLPVSELDCIDAHFDLCSTICENFTVNNYYRRCSSNREVNALCMDFTRILLRDLRRFGQAVDIARVFVKGSDSRLNNSISIIDSLVSALEFNASESALLFENNTNADSVVGLVDALLDDDEMIEWNNVRNKNDDDSPDRVLYQLETIAGLVGKSYINGSRNKSYSFFSNNTIMFVDKPFRKTNSSERTDSYTFPPAAESDASTSELNPFTKHATPLSLLCDQKDCSGVVSTTVVRNLPLYLDRRTNHSQSSNSFLLSIQILNSKVATNTTFEQEPIVLKFKPLETNESAIDFSSHKCAFWDFQKRNWSYEGIITSGITDDSQIECIASHLTSFAVLVSPAGATGTGAEAIALNIVSYIGCVISILCLIPTIFILLAFRERLNKGALLYIHLNLSIALLVALCIFVAGIETAATIKDLCITIAALLHYFFLCVFCWMLAEGIMLYLLVVRVFGTAAEKKWYYMLILGWGFPVPVVVVSAGVLRRNYIADNYCWLKGDPTQASIWTFIVPVALIILVNTVILIMTVFSIVRGKKRGGAETDVKNKQLIIAGVKGTVILLPLLGVTWIIGIFAVNNNTTVFAWIFTIFNSLQGMFILILHVLRNEVVLRRIRKFFFSVIRKEDAIGLSVKYSASQNATVAKLTLGTSDIFSPGTLKREEDSEAPAGMKSQLESDSLRKTSQSTVTSETMLMDNSKLSDGSV